MSYPIVILGSGRGTNAEALLKAESKKKLGAAKIAAVISDQEEAGILALGQKYKVPAIYIDPGRKGARLTDEAEQAFIERIRTFSPKLIVLAGFMRIIRRPFIEAFEGKMINLHPSLLPSFPGIGGIQQAFDLGVKVTGCTVHWVTLSSTLARLLIRRRFVSTNRIHLIFSPRRSTSLSTSFYPMSCCA